MLVPKAGFHWHWVQKERKELNMHSGALVPGSFSMKSEFLKNNVFDWCHFRYRISNLFAFSVQVIFWLVNQVYICDSKFRSEAVNVRFFPKMFFFG